MRAAEIRDNTWHIEPILDEGHACAKGFFHTTKLGAFFHQYGFKFIAFNRIIWSQGNFNSSWRPLIPGQTNHLRGPADLWGSVAANLSDVRTEHLTQMVRPTQQQIAAILDNHTEAERIARSISLSLRNIDISVEQITEFYNEQLVNHMSSGRLSGERVSTSLDQTLFAYVHTFFMHLGAVRDYLASLCALRIDKNPQKVDSLARLVDVVRSEHFESDDLLRLFHARGYFRQKPSSLDKFETSGWIKEATDLRNEFMHKCPYGDRFVEEMGFTEAVDQAAGVFRYVRPLVLGNTEDDVQNVILQHYREITGLCYEAAVTSGMNYSVLTLGKDDIISIGLNASSLLRAIPLDSPFIAVHSP
ncbi:hypothetical protein [Sphingomonas sp. MS122]|uniref:hypothetical protein n=1 Tax=Sphingomonas sp. MS122 TaxID=3412683 RepID=UPI003C2E5A53